jgi:hypothetical protein
VARRGPVPPSACRLGWIGSPGCPTSSSSSKGVAFGTAAGFIDQLTRLQGELSLNGIVAELDASGLIPAERVKQGLSIPTQQVIPAFM